MGWAHLKRNLLSILDFAIAKRQREDARAASALQSGRVLVHSAAVPDRRDILSDLHRSGRSEELRLRRTDHRQWYPAVLVPAAKAASRPG